MFNAISHSRIYVTDQDEALDFYVGKLGLEVSADVELDVMRWLTVNVPGNPDHHILLEVPKPPMYEEETAEQILDLISKGGAGMAILTTDDCRKTYEDLVAKGVEFTQEPVDRFYGVDAGLRDPFGNHIRITEPAPDPIELPEKGASL